MVAAGTVLLLYGGRAIQDQFFMNVPGIAEAVCKKPPHGNEAAL